MSVRRVDFHSNEYFENENNTLVNNEKYNNEVSKKRLKVMFW